jgi:hypothetical protein
LNAVIFSLLPKLKHEPSPGTEMTLLPVHMGFGYARTVLLAKKRIPDAGEWEGEGNGKEKGKRENAPVHPAGKALVANAPTAG